MNITYLIGNGFDLNIGLNTRYSDFMEEYIQCNDEVVKVSSLKKSIAEYCENKEQSDINWSDMEKGFGEFTYKFRDVEGGDEIIQQYHDHLCESLAEYLINEEKRFVDKNIVDNKKLLERVGKAFTSFSKGLQPDDVDRISSIFSTISGGYKINILDFNYTSTLDIVIKVLREDALLGTRIHNGNSLHNEIGTFIHVHGTTSHGMVFGVHDESQLCADIFSSEEPERKALLIKSEFNDAMGEGIEKKALDTIRNSHLIYVYGMSLGETDRRWWDRIINHMLSNRQAILILHDTKDPRVGINPFPHKKYQREQRNRFLAYSMNSQEDLNSITDRIYVTSANVFDCLEGFANAVYIPKTVS